MIMWMVKVSHKYLVLLEDITLYLFPWLLKTIANFGATDVFSKASFDNLNLMQVWAWIDLNASSRLIFTTLSTYVANNVSHCQAINTHVQCTYTCIYVVLFC